MQVYFFRNMNVNKCQYHSCRYCTVLKWLNCLFCVTRAFHVLVLYHWPIVPYRYCSMQTSNHASTIPRAWQDTCTYFLDIIVHVYVFYPPSFTSNSNLKCRLIRTAPPSPPVVTRLLGECTNSLLHLPLQHRPRLRLLRRRHQRTPHCWARHVENRLRSELRSQSWLARLTRFQTSWTSFVRKGRRLVVVWAEGRPWRCEAPPPTWKLLYCYTTSRESYK